MRRKQLIEQGFIRPDSEEEDEGEEKKQKTMVVRNKKKKTKKDTQALEQNADAEEND